jgi:hypothetical protein
LGAALLLLAAGCIWEGRHNYFEFGSPATADGSWLVGSNDQGYVGSQTGNFRTRR